MLEKLSGIVFKVQDTAKKSSLHYVVCMWKDPFGEINHRVGYFENSNEATMFSQMLQETYENKLRLPYRMYSSVRELNTIGNLCI